MRIYCCRFHEQWKFVTQRLVFVVAFAEFLLLRTLLTREQAAAKLNLSCDRSLDMLYLDLEDYLHGILLLPNELVGLLVTTSNNRNKSHSLSVA